MMRPKTTVTAVLAAVASILLVLSAPAPAAAQTEAASPPAFRFYVACGTSAKAKPSHRCQAPRKKGAFFRSNRADVFFKVCVKFPTRKSLCAPRRKALQGELYVNEISTNIRGVHRVSWFVSGKRVGVFKFLVPRKR